MAISRADLQAYRAYMLDAFQGTETRVTHSAMFVTVLGEPVPGKPVVSVAFVARDGTELPDVESLLETR